MRFHSLQRPSRPAWGTARRGGYRRSASILANYTQLARAYDKTDEVALRTLLAPDFEFNFVPGVKDDLTQYVGDWKFEKQHALDERVSIRVLHLALHADVADAEILLTRTYPLSAPGAIEVQRANETVGSYETGAGS